MSAVAFDRRDPPRAWRCLAPRRSVGGLLAAAVMASVWLAAPHRAHAADAPPAPNAPYDYWLTGNPADAQPAHTRAGLFLSGGGGDVAAAWKWFVACAGGGDIVILRASGGDGYQSYVFDRIGGVDSVETIKFNAASAAFDPRVLAILARADGIFLAGGDQARYVRYWKDTPVGAALNAHLRAGKPIGGTSAGLAVLGEFYFAALEDTITSAHALADPLDHRITLDRGFIRAPELAGVITDSHFMARNRLGRLIVFLARLGQSEKSPRLAGLGIDEATALCIEPGGRARVHTEKAGRAWLVRPTQPPETLVAGQPLRLQGVQVIGLGPDSELELADYTVKHPADRRAVSVADGKLLESLP